VTNPFPFVAGATLTAADLNAIGESETTWTPNFLTGVTVGNGTLSGTFQQVNDFVIVQGSFELGSTSAITGDVRVDVPITASNLYDLSTSTFVQMIDASLNRHWKGGGFSFGGTQVRLRAFYRDSSDYIYATAISGTIPFNWTTGDRLNWTQIYRVGS
jgi:hypothetical protein